MIAQPISASTIELFSKNGGNPLGLYSQKDPLMIVGYILQWQRAEDDEIMQRVGERILSRSVEKAKEMGLWHRFIYQNYAGMGQDVFEGYGRRNRERLEIVRRGVDPEGVFTRLQPGGFKVHDLERYPDVE